MTWRGWINVAGCFDELSPMERAVCYTERLRGFVAFLDELPPWTRRLFEMDRIRGLVEQLEAAQSVSHAEELLVLVFDWADENRVWIEQIDPSSIVPPHVLVSLPEET